ncbi:MAG: PepSY domain-containing protein, partial [Rhodocyclaceae bacterium]|nr:PepSY domain-containing protein [Rhodocyclaceae bacterium]
MNTAKYRPLLRRLHRWVALVLTPVFAIIILSGGVLALKPLFAPAAAQTNSAEGPAIAAALARIDPQGLATSVAVSPDGGSLVLQSRGSTGPSGSFDPASGIANAEQPGPDFFAIVLDLHKNLLLGLGIVVEIAAYAMSALIVVGLFLGLPRLRNTLLGWHQGVAWLALPLVVLAPLTGTLMALHIGTPSLPPIQQGPPIALASAIGSVAGQPDSGALVSARRFRAGSALVTTQGQQGALRYLVEPNGRIHALSEGP